MSQTVGDFLVERLHAWGVKKMFGYPGDGINGVFGALNRAILVGAGALHATDEMIAVADRLQAGAAKALLGKAALPDDLPWVTGSIGLLGTKPSWDLMMECATANGGRASPIISPNGGRRSRRAPCGSQSDQSAAGHLGIVAAPA